MRAVAPALLECACTTSYSANKLRIRAIARISLRCGDLRISSGTQSAPSAKIHSRSGPELGHATDTRWPSATPYPNELTYHNCRSSRGGLGDVENLQQRPPLISRNDAEVLQRPDVVQLRDVELPCLLLGGDRCHEITVDSFEVALLIARRLE